MFTWTRTSIKVTRGNVGILYDIFVLSVDTEILISLVSRRSQGWNLCTLARRIILIILPSGKQGLVRH